MRIAPGDRLDVVAPQAGFTKDQPVIHGALLIIPAQSAQEGEVVSCTYRGLFNGPIKPGDEPAYMGETAYFDGKDFTKTQPKTAPTDAVGVFVDGAVLLTGQLLSQPTADA